jgi:dihydroorotase-like cyclic amidohydrolase
METIISACISAGVTLLVCMINNHGQQEKTRALMEYKLDELTKRVEKHNSVVERTYILEEKMKVANHRIEDLERKVE